MELNNLEKLITAMDDKINLLADYMQEHQQANKTIPHKYIDLLPQYLASKQIDTKECSQYDKIKIFSKFITPCFEHMNMSDFTKISLNNWQSDLWQKKSRHGKQFAYNYLTKIRGYLYAFLEWCDCVYSIPNAIKSVKIPKNIQQVKIIAFWELTDFKRFIPHVDSLMYETLFTLLFYGGFRIGEVMALTETDFNGNAISVTKTLCRKTLDGALYKITPTKNYKNRLTPIPKIPIDKLDAYLAYKRLNSLPNTFLFGGNEPLAETTLRRVFKSYLKNSRAKRITLHGLRHSYVSMLAHLGVGTKKIAELIGDTEEQVLQTYSHLYKDDIITAVALINGLK